MRSILLNEIIETAPKRIRMADVPNRRGREIPSYNTAHRHSYIRKMGIYFLAPWDTFWYFQMLWVAFFIYISFWKFPKVATSKSKRKSNIWKE